MPANDAQPRAEVVFLKRLVGDWQVTASSMGDAAGWGETVRSLADTWFVAEGGGTMEDGSAAITILTLGFDPARGRVVGTWIGSMMAHLWVYDGELSDDATALSLYASGPDVETPGLERLGATREYREHIAFTDDDHRVFTSSIREADGSWKTIMEARYARKG